MTTDPALAFPTLHAGAVARLLDGRRAGVLIVGESGAGKSDLALRLCERGWRLIADDRTVVWRSGERLYARAPAVLSGLIEARGMGVGRVQPVAFAPLALVAACESDSRGLERTPEPERFSLHGLDLPRVRLAAREASAPARLALALSALRL